MRIREITENIPEAPEDNINKKIVQKAQSMMSLGIVAK